MSRTKKSRGFQPRPSPPGREPSRRDVDREMTAEYIGGDARLYDEVTLMSREFAAQFHAAQFYAARAARSKKN